MIDYVIFARWFGLVSLFLSLGILFNLEDAKKMAINMARDESGYIMGGVLPIIFGSLALLFVNNLVNSWSLIILAVGLSMVLAGLFRVVFVRQWKMMINANVEKIPFLFSLFGLMFGVILLYIGFFANTFE